LHKFVFQRERASAQRPSVVPQGAEAPQQQAQQVQAQQVQQARQASPRAESPERRLLAARQLHRQC
jgi:hypothetical protein